MSLPCREHFRVRNRAKPRVAKLRKSGNQSDLFLFLFLPLALALSLSSPISLSLQLAVLRLRETPKDLRVRATGNPKETVRRRGLLFCSRGRFRAAFTLSLVQQKAASLSTFRVLAHFTVRVCLRFVLERKTEEYMKRGGEERSKAWHGRTGQGRKRASTRRGREAGEERVGEIS